ncbi:hypothetical protein TOPH_03918 [Tolypocladium ophioglossoides CBS 100239]|uniref:ubiquitinyl hydrolase 1 n=1 Tax=Tolypocladium ophioglossoides (strain CBS 100239) TaxID=1163406 RepID=A0A0L0NC47_TOLOC|nr:hypothetical protein TOPH_03918 [Tolypocladium ophioglossoides CBS 100239]
MGATGTSPGPNREGLPAGWKEAVVPLAVSISALQAAERLWRVRDNTQDLVRELSGLEPRTWDPKAFPDSLLLEVEGNIRIRRVQEDIAATMRDPPSRKNAFMQLNMGEGKSSVIDPIVAAALADGLRLVRVIVAKPQSRQMLDILVSKLGGVMNRRIYQMPLSRSVKLDASQVRILANYYQQCAASGGVMLVQPEHVLSFQLMTVETAIRGETALAKSMWDMHDMLNSKARDIVDESDENFSTKFELIYTVGDQRSIGNGPERWIIIQEVLGIVGKYSRQAKTKFPRGVELDEVGRSSFPLIRFLNSDSGHDILRQSIAHICKLGAQGFPIGRQAKR